MSSPDIQLAVTLTTASGKNSTGAVWLHDVHEGERIRRTCVLTAVAFGVTVGLLAVPILHFVLVPLGLLGTVATALMTARIRKRITGGSGPCPECASTVKIMARPFRFPFRDVCETCRREITVSVDPHTIRTRPPTI